MIQNGLFAMSSGDFAATAILMDSVFARIGMLCGHHPGVILIISCLGFKTSVYLVVFG